MYVFSHNRSEKSSQPRLKAGLRTSSVFLLFPLVFLIDDVAFLFEIEELRRDSALGRFGHQSQRRALGVVAHPHSHIDLAFKKAAGAEELRFEADGLDLPAIGLDALAFADEDFKLIVLFVRADGKGKHLALMELLQPHEIDGRKQAEHPLLAR